MNKTRPLTAVRRAPAPASETPREVRELRATPGAGEASGARATREAAHPTTTRDVRQSLSRGGLRRAEVLDVADEDTVLLRLHRATTEEVLHAELAVPGYQATAGDRVLVDEGEDGWFVLGVLGPARRRESVSAALGLVATSHGEGGVELRVTQGDLTLSAAGRVVVRAGTEVSTTAETVRTTASLLAESVGRRELEAERVVERATDVYRQVSGLVQTSAGRVRTMVEGDHDMHAGKTNISSEDDTSVDGKRVLLG